MYFFSAQTQLDETKMFDMSLWIHVFYVCAKQQQHCCYKTSSSQSI